MQLSRRMDRFGDEIFAALNKRKLEMEQEGRVIYNLSVGTPDFETAPHIREALIDAAKDPENWKYALRDTPELLEAVCAYYKKRFDVEIEPDMVCSCYGSEEGMGHIGLVLCDEGDTVILPTPCYPVFIAGAQMAGAVPPQGYAMPPQGYTMTPQGYAVPSQGYAMPSQNYENVNVQPASFQPFTGGNALPGHENIDLIMDVPLEVTVELGRTTKSIKEILEFAPGTIVELNKIAGELIDVLVNGKYVAKGEVVVIEESFGVKITEIVK